MLIAALESRRKAGASLSCSRICGNSIMGWGVATAAKPLSIAVRLCRGVAGTGSFRLAAWACASPPPPDPAIPAIIAANLRSRFIVRPRRTARAEDQVLGEAGRGRLLVLRVHVL